MRILISINLGISNINYRPENQNIEITDEKCLNLSKPNPNLENAADHMLFEEAKNVENEGTKDCFEKDNKSKVQSEASQDSKPKYK